MSKFCVNILCQYSMSIFCVNIICQHSASTFCVNILCQPQDYYIMSSMAMLSLICVWHAVVTTTLFNPDHIVFIDKCILVVLGAIYALMHLLFLVLVYFRVFFKNTSLFLYTSIFYFLLHSRLSLRIDSGGFSFCGLGGGAKIISRGCRAANFSNLVNLSKFTNFR